MESLIQVRIENVIEATDCFIEEHNNQQLDQIWALAQTHASPGFRIGSMCIVKPITTEKAFQTILEIQANRIKVPLEQIPKAIKDDPWYHRAHALRCSAPLSHDETMWLSVSDAAHVVQHVNTIHNITFTG